MQHSFGPVGAERRPVYFDPWMMRFGQEGLAQTWVSLNGNGVAHDVVARGDEYFGHLVVVLRLEDGLRRRHGGGIGNGPR